MDPRTRAAVAWLLGSGEPAIRLMTRRDLLGERADDDAGQVLAGAKVTALLSGQQSDGGFGVHPYRKWTGAHWRLVSLVELAVPPREPRAVAAAGHVLAWLASPARRVPRIGGLARAHASVEGNALAACCRLGLAADPRVRSLAEALISWQWPDGGWNCDPAATGRSSFHESLAAAWGLHEYGQATGDTAAQDAASRAAELFLAHRLFRTLGSGQVIDRAWLAPHYPPYWHYDILQALLVLSRMGKAGDPRAGDALDELERRRRPDGRWQPAGCWWKPPASTVAPEVADWGRSGPKRDDHAERAAHPASRRAPDPTRHTNLNPARHHPSPLARKRATLPATALANDFAEALPYTNSPIPWPTTDQFVEISALTIFNYGGYRLVFPS
jgi:hypothetical protein